MQGKKTGGRKVGSQNKLPSVRVAFEEAFANLQNSDDNSLEAWAKKNPTKFYFLVSKLLPMCLDVNQTTSINVVTGVPRPDTECDGEDLV